MNISIGSAFSAANIQARIPQKEKQECLNEEAKRAADFMRVLKEFDRTQETEADRVRRKAREEKALQQKRDKERRIGALQSRIAQLRSKLMSNFGDPKALKAELAIAQTELFWLIGGG